ncbi:SesA domain-containing protein [Aeromonas phage PVN02]|nr:SesA domain-containing protein [Aeromonas phage PVN02]QTQ06874.1 hypothetical protein [Aeromonas phage PVN04]CAC9972304.1 hypothetical protein PVN02_00037 [Aeromonas phage PVN02]
MEKINHELVNKQGKVLFSSTRKLDTVFAHQKYKRSQGVQYRESKVVDKPNTTARKGR